MAYAGACQEFIGGGELSLLFVENHLSSPRSLPTLSYAATAQEFIHLSIYLLNLFYEKYLCR